MSDIPPSRQPAISGIKQSRGGERCAFGGPCCSGFGRRGGPFSCGQLSRSRIDEDLRFEFYGCSRTVGARSAKASAIVQMPFAVALADLCKGTSPYGIWNRFRLCGSSR